MRIAGSQGVPGINVAINDEAWTDVASSEMHTHTLSLHSLFTRRDNFIAYTQTFIQKTNDLTHTNKFHPTLTTRKLAPLPHPDLTHTHTNDTMHTHIHHATQCIRQVHATHR